MITLKDLEAASLPIAGARPLILAQQLTQQRLVGRAGTSAITAFADQQEVARQHNDPNGDRAVEIHKRVG